MAPLRRAPFPGRNRRERVATRVANELEVSLLDDRVVEHRVHRPLDGPGSKVLPAPKFTK